MSLSVALLRGKLLPKHGTLVFRRWVLILAKSKAFYKLDLPFILIRAFL
jgi:hypothetical protein